MENAAQKLGGGPPTPEEQAHFDVNLDTRVTEMERVIAESGVQEAPTSPSTPTQVEREDLLEYKLLGQRAANAELQVTMYSRELQRSQADANTIAHEAANFMKLLEAKYKTDLRLFMITEDGYLVQRPIDQRQALMRK
jgi:hypothetical protein